MAFTKEQREKAAATRAANKAAREAGISRVASVKHVAPNDLKSLTEQIADLQAKLGVETERADAAERAALASAESQGLLLQRGIEEVPTGKKVEVRRCTGYKSVGHKDDGRDIMRPIFETVKVPTYFYKIDLPPIGGMDLKINGTPLHHGAVYEFDVDTLRTVKDIVYRSWRHDADIHKSDENFYRKLDPAWRARNQAVLRG